MKIFESRRRQLEWAAPSVAKNQRLCESVKALEKMLAGAQDNQDKLRAEKTQLEAENWELKNQLGDGTFGVLLSYLWFALANRNLLLVQSLFKL